jgi:cytochrome c oxidase cbb3-type subunit 3
MTDETNAYDAADTGHVWDDNLRELTNPPPRWWTIAFHASWIFVVIYGILYPMWPTFSGYTKGVIGWTSIGEYKESVAQLEEIRGPFEAKIADRELANYTDASAKVLFGDRCAPCHGAGGQGNPGYPVLADVRRYRRQDRREHRQRPPGHDAAARLALQRPAAR